MVTYEEIGRRIKEARQELGLVQADLGQMLSRRRSHAAVSDIERGKTKLDLEELAEIAQLLQKPLSYLTDPAPSPASVTYRRSTRHAPAAQLRESDRAIEAFKQKAREQARRANPTTEG